jgi:GntR family transcriptional regulator
MSPRRPGGPAEYQRIADALREHINDLPDGARLPGEDEIMKQHGVARATARSALAVLKNEGLVVSRTGSGTFVRRFRPLRRHGSRRLSSQHIGSGKAVWDADTGDRPYRVDRLTVTQVPAPADAATALGLRPGTDIIRRERRYLVEDRPVQLATSSMPADIAAGTPITHDDPGPGGIYARLADLGFAPVHFAEELRARMPSPDEITALQLPTGTPVITIRRRAFAASGRTVELNEITIDASAYILEYDFDA